MFQSAMAAVTRANPLARYCWPRSRDRASGRGGGSSRGQQRRRYGSKTPGRRMLSRALRRRRTASLPWSASAVAGCCAGCHEFTVGRHHSLHARLSTLPPELAVAAETEDGVVMAIQHLRLPIAAEPTRFFDGAHWEEAQRRRIAQGGHVPAAGQRRSIWRPRRARSTV